MESADHSLKTETAQKLDTLTELIKDSLSLIYSGFYKGKAALCDEADQKTKEIRHLLEQLQKESSQMSITREEAASTATVLSHYQKICFNLVRLNSLTRSKNNEGILFTEKAVMELEELFRGIKNIFNHLNDVIFTRNAVLIDYILKEKKKYKQLSRKFAQEHEERLIKGVCPVRSSSFYLSMLDSLEDILWHLQAILEELKK